MSNKVKIDKELFVFSQFLKKTIQLYDAYGINFSFNYFSEEDKTSNEVVINEHSVNIVVEPKNGLLPMFLEEVNEMYKNKKFFLGKQEGLPIVYSKNDESLFGIEPEIFETDKKSKEALLTVMLSTLDFWCEDRIRKAYQNEFGDKAEFEMNNQTPIKVDITDVYENCLLKISNELINVQEEPKLERMKHQKPTIQKPKQNNQFSSGKIV